MTKRITMLKQKDQLLQGESYNLDNQTAGELLSQGFAKDAKSPQEEKRDLEQKAKTTEAAKPPAAKPFTGLSNNPKP